MSQAAPPTDGEIDAAARVLYKEGSLHHWWPNTGKTYDEFATADPIGASELAGVVERVLIAAQAKRDS